MNQSAWNLIHFYKIMLRFLATLYKFMVIDVIICRRTVECYRYFAILVIFMRWNFCVSLQYLTHFPANIYLAKPILEALEKRVKYVQS